MVKDREPCSMYVAAWLGRKFGGEWIHVYEWLSPFTVPLKLPKHCKWLHPYLGFPGGSSAKEPACQCRRHKRCGSNPQVGKIPLEEGTATLSSILAWRIPWTEEPGGLQSVGLQRVRHDCSDSVCMHTLT